MISFLRVIGKIRRKDFEVKSLLVLTPRQRDTLQLVAEGKTLKEIAVIHKNSLQTVKNTMANSRARLNAKSTPHAVAIGICKNHISPILDLDDLLFEESL